MLQIYGPHTTEHLNEIKRMKDKSYKLFTIWLSYRSYNHETRTRYTGLPLPIPQPWCIGKDNRWECKLTTRNWSLNMEVGGGRVVEKVESRNFFSELLREEPERVVQKKQKCPFFNCPIILGEPGVDRVGRGRSRTRGKKFDARKVGRKSEKKNFGSTRRCSF